MNSPADNKIFLFSVDLEDVRFRMPDGEMFKERVPVNTRKYLDWLGRNKCKCTFFVVGDVAEKYPSLIGEIVSEGHEIACHSNRHIPLDMLGPDEFRKDIETNVNALLRAGGKDITGFRAPVFSLTKKSEWAYEILQEMKFVYSSSVLPAKNPLYGWKEFGTVPKKVNSRIIEVPMSISGIGFMSIPFAGGVYFRMLPAIILKYLAGKFNIAKAPLIGYFHPYDIDTEQEHYMHPGLENNRFYNWLMYKNRHTVFQKLELIINSGFKIIPYHSFVADYMKN